MCRCPSPSLFGLSMFQSLTATVAALYTPEPVLVVRHWMRQQCFNNTVFNIAACQLQGRAPHLWKNTNYQGWKSLLLISTLDIQKSVWDSAKELGDEDMPHRIWGSDNKCPDMVAYYFQYRRVCINAYMTSRVHSQKKACPNTHAMLQWTQLVSHRDEPLFRDGAIFLAMFTHTGRSHEMKVSYFEASQRWVSMAWCISIPSNMNKLATLTTMSAERIPAFQYQSTSK